MAGIKIVRETTKPRGLPAAASQPPVSAGGDDLDWGSAATGTSPSMPDQWKQPAVAATTGPITLATDLNVGDTIDGRVLVDGDRVVVKDQAAPAENGIWIAGAMPARAPEMDQDSEVVGTIVYIITGTVNGGTIWYVTNTTPPVVDTDPIYWAEFTGSTSPTGAAGGDLGGTYPNPSVLQINGSPLGTTTGASVADRLRWSGTAWEASSLIWRPVMTLDPTSGNYLPVTSGGDAVMTEA